MIDLSDIGHISNCLEKFVQETLYKKKYKFVSPNRFKASLYLRQPVYTRNYNIGQTIYDTTLEASFILFHPTKWPKCLVVETKWQETSGSVDEKLPYLVSNIQKKQNFKTVVLLDGGGYRKGAEKWLQSEIGKKLIHVFNRNKFERWISEGNI